MSHREPTGVRLYDADTEELIEAPHELRVRWPDGRERVLRLRVARGEVRDAECSECGGAGIIDLRRGWYMCRACLDRLNAITGSVVAVQIPTEPDGTE